ncbi:MAG: queuosine precursor transporter [Bacteroidota bacterium]
MRLFISFFIVYTMVGITIRQFWNHYKRGWLATFLMTNLTLSFCMSCCYLVIGGLPLLPAGMFFFALYYTTLCHIAATNPDDARQLACISGGAGLLLFAITKGILYIPTASSSLATRLLWESLPRPWILIYQFFLWIRTLSLLRMSKVTLWRKKIMKFFFPAAIQKKKSLFNWLDWDWSRLFYVLLLILFKIGNWVPQKEWLLVAGSMFSFESVVLISNLLIPFFSTQEKRQLSTSMSWLDRSSYHFFLFFFVGVCLTTNLLVVRHITLGSYTCTAGVLTYPLTFLLIDIITELYGRHQAKEAIWAGLLSNILFLIAVLMIALLPMTVESKLFWNTFGFVSASLVASLIAYMIAQFMSIHLFCTLRNATQGNYLWLRNNLTTIISQGADTLVFSLVAWGIWYYLQNSEALFFSLQQWMQISFNEYIIKVVFALLDTPILYIILGLLRWMGVGTSSYKKLINE